MNNVSERWTTPGHFTYTPKESGNYIVTVSGAGGGGGGGVKCEYKYSTGGKYSRTRTGYAYASGGSGGRGGRHCSRDYNGSTNGANGFVALQTQNPLVLTPSGTFGEITLNASRSFFSSDLVGAWLKLEQYVPSVTVSQNGGGTSGDVLVGDKWKIITHGTWTGTITIQKNDNGTWKDYRTYKSSNDFNASTVEQLTRMRLVSTAGNADLTALPYTNEGLVEITGVNSGTQAKCHVHKNLANTNAITYCMISAWCEQYGYPSTVAFFQDRLCLGGSVMQPYNVWMSRTGDYPNFSVE